MRAIIPAAGFGTRMGMKSNQSKEMLPDPNSVLKKHIIDYSLGICQVYDLCPLVIVREEKEDLISYLNNKGVEIMIIDPQREWQHTVLESQYRWYEDNLLILPDTRFQPYKIIEQIEIGLNLGNKAVFALHKVVDPVKWGIIYDYKIVDKPICFEEPQWAWGLIGFKDEYGEELFNKLDKSTPNERQLNNVGFVYLDSFKDITRRGK